MKVYSVPSEVPAPVVDWIHFDYHKMVKDQSDHQARLKAWLVSQGYTGKNTGKIVRFQVADGYAVYMMAEGRKSVLIHLPYGDSYQYPDVRFLPKKEILRRIAQEENLSKLFRAAV